MKDGFFDVPGFCPKCGHKLVGAESICPRCGYCVTCGQCGTGSVILFSKDL